MLVFLSFIVGCKLLIVIRKLLNIGLGSYVSLEFVRGGCLFITEGVGKELRKGMSNWVFGS